MANKHWMVGQIRQDGWEFQGIFDDEGLAQAACRFPDYFVQPVTMNESLPHETVQIPGCYFPLGESNG
jgi:hypothetical protein